MRVGVVSPNLLSNVPGFNAMSEDPNMPWPFEVLAKRASMLFDRLYLTEDLDLTCEVIGGGSAICDDDPNCATLRYLADKALILLPQHLGYTSGAAFLQSNLKGEGRRLHAALLKVGNPSNNCGPGEYTYVGQPDIGDFEAHDGNHPRSHKGDKDPPNRRQNAKIRVPAGSPQRRAAPAGRLLPRLRSSGTVQPEG